MKTLSPFVRQYLETALWSSTDDETPLDENYGIEDLSISAIEKAERDCDAFQAENASDIAGFDLTDVAHDFWLTRNGHGAGFWDGDYPEPMATRLTDSAHAFGEIYLYVGDSGELYFFS